MVDLRGSNTKLSRLQENLLQKLSEIDFNLDGLTKTDLKTLKKQIIQALPRLRSLYQENKTKCERSPGIVNLSYANKVPEKVMVVSLLRRGDGHAERLQRICEKGGWQYQWCAPEKFTGFDGKRSKSKSIALVDLDHEYFSNINFISYLEKLKLNFDFVVGFAFDGWSYNSNVHDELVRNCLDLVWCPNKYFELYSNNLPVNKVTPFPIPPGISSYDHCTILSNVAEQSNIKFSGNIERQSFPRLLWFIEKSKKIGVEFDLSNYKARSTYHEYDSYISYLGRLRQCKAVINFSTRNDMSRGYTGRSAETIAMRQPLLQEYCPAFNILYKPGEHFLQFSNIKDFDNIYAQVMSSEFVSREIAESAYSFFQERYSDRRLLEHLTAALDV